MELPIVVLGAVALLLIAVCTYMYVYWKSKDFPPGPYGLPLLGYGPFLGAKPYVTLSNLSKKYGPILSVNMGDGHPVIVINDWPSAREVLIKQGEIFGFRPNLFVFRLLLQDRDNDIIATSGPVTKELKRESTNILKELGMGQAFLETMIVAEIEKLSTYLRGRDNELVDIDTILFIPLTNVVWRLTSGNVFDMNDAKMNSFANAIHTMSAQTSIGILNMWPFLRHVIPELSGYRRFKAAAQKVIAYIDTVVRQHWRDAGTAVERQTDFIHCFIKKIKRRQEDNTDWPPYCNKYLSGAALDIFTAGIETTDTTLNWSLAMMAHHPEIQKKVQTELDKVMDRDGHLPYFSRNLIPYTMATLCEIQRFASVAPFGVPHCTGRDATLCGFKIPKGTTVLVNLWALHHDQEYWTNAENFLPERFLNEDGTLKRHDRYIPFSAGPRSCMGEPLAKLELALFFTCLMRRFTFQLDPSQKNSSSLEPNMGFVLRLPAFSLLIRSR